MREMALRTLILCVALLTLSAKRVQSQSLSFSEISSDQALLKSPKERLRELLSKARKTCKVTPSPLLSSDEEWVVALHLVTLERSRVKVSLIYRAITSEKRRKTLRPSRLAQLIRPSSVESYQRSLLIENELFYLLEEWSLLPKPKSGFSHQLSHPQHWVEVTILEIDKALFEDSKEEILTRGRAPSLPAPLLTNRHYDKEEKTRSTLEPLTLCGTDIAPELVPTSLLLWRSKAP